MLAYKNEKKSPLEYQQRSGILSESGLICIGKSTLIGFLVIPDGTNNITINVYDNVESSGSLVIPEITVLGSDNYFGLDLTPGLLVETGIFVDISVAGGGSCNYQVYFDN